MDSDKKKDENLNSGNKKKAILNLIPAAATVIAVAASVVCIKPDLQEIPELLNLADLQKTAAVEAKAAEPSTEAALGAVLTAVADANYTDGVFTGSAQGYGGPVEVEVTVEGGKITSIKILNSSGETASFFNRAATLVDTVLAAQTWEVDTVSGATYSSKGILGAIENALTGTTVVNETAAAVQTPAQTEAEAFNAPAAYKDGVYTGTAQGFGGPITVSVTIADGKISDVSIVSAESETASYFNRAKTLTGTIVAAQSPMVDVVSGATYSSNGIINAVKRALNQAAADDSQVIVVEETTESLEEDTSNAGSNALSATLAEGATPAVAAQVVDESGNVTQKYKDGVYTGTAEGFGGDVTVQVTIENGQITSVESISAEDETPKYYQKALAVLPNIVQQQSTEVDVVSGATYSSNGLIHATEDALAKAEEAQKEENAAKAAENQNAGAQSQTTQADKQNAGSQTTGTDTQNTGAGSPYAGQSSGTMSAASLPNGTLYGQTGLAQAIDFYTIVYGGKE